MPTSTFIRRRNQAAKTINSEVSLSTNAKIVKKSPSTIYRWSKVDMSINAQKFHLAQRGRKPVLSEDEERAVKEFITLQAEKAVPTSGKDIISFISTLSNGCFHLTKGFVSKLCQKLKVRSKTQKKRNNKQLRATYEDEVEEFHQKIKNLNAKPSE